MNEVEGLVESVERAREELLTRVSGLSEPQAMFKPSEGQWSVAEVLEHLYLAELAGVAKIWAALEAIRAGKGWTEPRPNQDKSIEEIVAETWKAKELAPPIATPHIGGPLPFWVAATRSAAPLLAELGVQRRGTKLDGVVFPHFLCGPLDARQRLEFLRFHIERHVGQIARVRSATAFPD